ncbi:beta-galactosidase 7-like [Cucurbita pepo subsp. pepo]|uniref:beta-galactosidase 7-like n=2 Tax=Cucurbita pepo subsp. pepo TaxID=3664 RepID=UPI000C9D92D2|nr:beta-galactosidase 7-like [Cucurbita pepo subsp. pepo]
MFNLGSLVLCLFVILSGLSFCTGNSVTYDSNAIIINGERRIIFSGSIHYPRSTDAMWPDLIKKAKDGGLDAIETYIFWDRHEPQRQKYDFSGNLDFIKFFQLIHDAGLYVLMRIGPYVCAEWNYGGFPVWLHNMPGIEFRTDNKVYKNEMQTFTTKIVNMCKQANLFATQGGPIIIAQIENEYGNVMTPYGDAGKTYINWCAQMAESLNIGVPWIMCQQSDAPQPMINTCNGFYCDNFTPNNPKSPKMFTENWVGWFKKWGEKDPHRTAEDVAFSVAKFFQFGGVLNNYYMYHGGTNFGRTSGGPFITTSYDYDAPIDEYGNLNQPKWGHLKQLHASIKLGEKILTSSTRSDRNISSSVTLTTFSNPTTGGRFCFLSNTDASNDANIDLEADGTYFVPAWSVTILDGCNKEVYNTAKVNSQTSVFVKEQDEKENAQLSWTWAREHMRDTLLGTGTFKANQLLEQKGFTVDVSDYLWYMTNVDIDQTSSPRDVTLQVNTKGHVLHAFVNRRHIGSEWANNGQSFVLEKPISLKSGTNTITLLSATVGLKNYDAFYDMVPTGIDGGPVYLIGSGNVTTNLSSNSWSYKVGLNGEMKQFYNPTTHSSKVKWRPFEHKSIGRRMAWFKTNFKTPSGVDPVVLDLQGMGKGQGWVNGQSIGRFWPSFIANNDNCSETCDYRGAYESSKCVGNCGNPSQRWYHIPRSFLSGDTNTLILFEEIGGNPKQISVQTITIQTICGHVNEGSTLELSCQGGRIISEIQFASYGNPEGKCGSYKHGLWNVVNTLLLVEKACIGKENCSIDVTGKSFEISDATSSFATLAVQALCSKK